MLKNIYIFYGTRKNNRFIAIKFDENIPISKIGLVISGPILHSPKIFPMKYQHWFNIEIFLLQINNTKILALRWKYLQLKVNIA